MQSSASRSLLETIDGLLVDIDGVVVLDDTAIAGAGPALQRAAAQEIPTLFVTNNAARTPAEVVAALVGAGLSVSVEQVMTSAMAAAATLVQEFGMGAPVLVVGGAGLHEAVATAGLRAVSAADEGPVAVVQGWGPSVGWPELAEATLAVRAGARWVATNLDRTLPTSRGLLPGSGALVAAVATALGRQPDVVVGKPYPPLLVAARERLGAQRPLMVGDRLDTDIAGARAVGIPALFVLTGVSTAHDLLAAAPQERPAYLGRDLASIGDVHPDIALEGARARCRETLVTTTPDGITVTGETTRGDGLDGLRALAHLAWAGQLAAEQYDSALTALTLS